MMLNQFRHFILSKSVAVLLVPLVLPIGASASDVDKTAGSFGAWDLPLYADSWNGFEGTVEWTPPMWGGMYRLKGTYEYSNGETGEIEQGEAQGPELIFVQEFTVPAPNEPMIGEVALRFWWDFLGVEKEGASVETTLPVSYVEELDVTGNPPVELLYPLGDDSHLVRYIPCCNIFGGVLNVERNPVNPTDTDAGLPEQRFSDFVTLEPDSLVESTAGLYMQFTYDPAAVKATGVGDVAPYVFLGDKWDPVYSFDHDAEGGTIDFHYPEGGLFVLAAKSRS